MELLSIDSAELCPFRPAAIFLRRQKKLPLPPVTRQEGEQKPFLEGQELNQQFSAKYLMVRTI